MVALNITTPTPLPRATIGTNYILALQAEGGTTPYTWAVHAGALPPGMSLTAQGVLMGIPTPDCGTYTATVRVTDSAGSPGHFDKDLTIFSGNLPGASDVLERLKLDDPKGVNLFVLNKIADACLAWLSSHLSIPLAPGSCSLTTITDEPLFVNSYKPVTYTVYWPVVTLTKVDYAGGAVLRVGTMRELLSGKADIAINDEGRELRLFQRRCDGYNGLFATYTAGMLTLPADLRDVWLELCMLTYKEKDRHGLDSDKLDKQEIKFTRKFPDWMDGTLQRYRRLIYA